MPLVDMKDMLNHAYHHGYAVGAFDLVSLDFLQGIMTAAERTRVPVAIHLDHGTSLASAIAAINHGCNGVMVDDSSEPLSINIQTTCAVVDMAHACGVPVEGELGYVPGVEGEDAERHPGEVAYTTPEEARTYVEQTGVDFLAVSIGTVHGRMEGKPKLDFQRLQQINESLAIPLVIHGGTGLSDNQFRQLIANGVAKINYYTALSDTAAKQINENTEAGFDYNEEDNTFACPGGQRLEMKRESEDGTRTYQGEAETCANCPYQSRCCQSKKGNARSITCDDKEPLRQQMNSKMEKEDAKAVYKERKIIVEPVFGQIKNMGFRGFSVRGKEKAAGEFSLVCAVHNIKKIAKAMIRGVVRPGCGKLIANPTI